MELRVGVSVVVKCGQGVNRRCRTDESPAVAEGARTEGKKSENLHLTL